MNIPGDMHICLFFVSRRSSVFPGSDDDSRHPYPEEDDKSERRGTDDESAAGVAGRVFCRYVSIAFRVSDRTADYQAMGVLSGRGAGVEGRVALFVGDGQESGVVRVDRVYEIDRVDIAPSEQPDRESVT